MLLPGCNADHNHTASMGVRLPGTWARIEGARIDADPNVASTIVPTKPLFMPDGGLEPAACIIGEESTVRDHVMVLNVICMPHQDLSKDCRNQIIL